MTRKLTIRNSKTQKLNLSWGFKHLEQPHRKINISCGHFMLTLFCYHSKCDECQLRFKCLTIKDEAMFLSTEQTIKMFELMMGFKTLLVWKDSNLKARDGALKRIFRT